MSLVPQSGKLARGTGTFAARLALRALRALCRGMPGGSHLLGRRASSEGRPRTDPSRCLFCGRCVDACPTGAREILGRRVTVAELVAQFERDVIFYDQSGGGVTCSGGEPLAQPAFLAALLKECQAREIHTAVDTSCYAPWDVVESVGRYADLFLVDLKHMDHAAHERLTGVSNEPILRNLRGLVQWKKDVVVRLPIIPGLTDGDANVRATAEFLASLGGVRRIDILPHNEASRGKTARLATRLATQREAFEAEPPSAERMQQIAERLEAYGFFVTIGG